MCGCGSIFVSLPLPGDGVCPTREMRCDHGFMFKGECSGELSPASLGNLVAIGIACTTCSTNTNRVNKKVQIRGGEGSIVEVLAI